MNKPRNHQIRINGMSQEEINSKITLFESYGWTYIGVMSGFPPGYDWIRFDWLHESDPIEPDIKSNN